MDKDYLKVHRQIFTEDKEITLFYSPGRVNLIGEHIDYNGGYVLPLALTIGNYGTFAFREDNEIHLFSDSFQDNGAFTTRLDSLAYKQEDDWANYIKGVIYFLIQKGFPIQKGFNITISSSLPSGAGLSSSASIEALIAVMMNEMFDLKLDRTYLSLLTQEVENKYINVNCGIMDQFVILNAEENAAIMLDTATLKFEIVPLNLEDVSIVIINSKKKRGLVDSQYNRRREECDLALSIFREHLEVKDLCSISLTEFNQFSGFLHQQDLLKRARHAVTEQQRVLNTKRALEENDLVKVGQYLNESHKSLRDDYQVSVKELDLLVDIAQKHQSLGSRMTGAGFGGCTVNLVYKQNLKHFIDNVKNEYFQQTGYLAEFYIASASNKTSKIEGISHE